MAAELSHDSFRAFVHIHMSIAPAPPQPTTYRHKPPPSTRALHYCIAQSPWARHITAPRMEPIELALLRCPWVSSLYGNSGTANQGPIGLSHTFYKLGANE